MEKKEIQLAKLFHDTYERLAPEFGYTTREDTKEFNENSPNGKLMVAVCKEVVLKELDKAKREVLERILENIPVCRNLNGYEGEGWIMEDDLRNILSKLTTK